MAVYITLWGFFRAVNGGFLALGIRGWQCCVPHYLAMHTIFPSLQCNNRQLYIILHSYKRQ
jgi:hypothetical protein